jgi:hypothetical protein
MKLGCLLLALVALALLSPALDWAIRAVGQSLADGVLILAASAGVAGVVLAMGVVWALKPQPPRPALLYMERVIERREFEPLGLPEQAIDAEWWEVEDERLRV